jgi:4'-phosphopantetheinyl transferase
VLYIHWQIPLARPILEDHVLHIWRVQIDQSPSVREIETLLSEPELKRAQKFHFEKDRRRFIASRAALKIILGRYLDLPPDQVVIQNAELGKPFISQRTQGETLQFNISHSHNMVLYAIAARYPVGIDLEYMLGASEQIENVSSFFSDAEKAAIGKADNKREMFFQIWTLKESYLKASGDGLRHELNEFSVILQPESSPRLTDIGWDRAEANRWSMAQFTPDPGYMAAVTVEGQAWDYV